MFKVVKIYRNKCHLRRSGVFIVNFEHISHLFLQFFYCHFEQVNVSWDERKLVFKLSQNLFFDILQHNVGHNKIECFQLCLEWKLQFYLDFLLVLVIQLHAGISYYLDQYTWMVACICPVAGKIIGIIQGSFQILVSNIKRIKRIN